MCVWRVWPHASPTLPSSALLSSSDGRHRSPCNLLQSAAGRQISARHPEPGRLARLVGDTLEDSDEGPRVSRCSHPLPPCPPSKYKQHSRRLARVHLSTYRNAELQVALVYPQQPHRRHSLESNIGGHCSPLQTPDPSAHHAPLELLYLSGGDIRAWRFSAGSDLRNWGEGGNVNPAMITTAIPTSPP